VSSQDPEGYSVASDKVSLARRVKDEEPDQEKHTGPWEFRQWISCLPLVKRLLPKSQLKEAMLRRELSLDKDELCW